MPKEVLEAGYDRATECIFEDGVFVSRTREVPVLSGGLGGYLIDQLVGPSEFDRVDRPKCPLLFRCEGCIDKVKSDPETTAETMGGSVSRISDDISNGVI